MPSAPKRFEVASYGEIFFIGGLFLFVLIILYPKAMLQEQVLAESSNYDLTIAYLRNMIKLEPQNDKLLVKLVKLSIEHGKFDLSNELLVLLSKTPTLIEYRRLLEYQMLKAQKGLHVTLEHQNEIEAKMSEKMREAVQAGVSNLDVAKAWFDEAIAANNVYAALYFLSLLILEHEPQWLERCLYLAGSQGAYALQLECVDGLLLIDKARRNEWMRARYHVALAGNYKQTAIESALMLAQSEPRYYEEAATLYASIGNFKAAADVMLERYKLTQDVALLLRAIEWLRAGNEIKAMVALMQRYEQRYLDDTAVMNAMMRIYLAAERLKEARLLAKRLLRRLP